jgi:hypothetical protein
VSSSLSLGANGIGAAPGSQLSRVAERPDDVNRTGGLLAAEIGTWTRIIKKMTATGTEETYLHLFPRPSSAVPATEISGRLCAASEHRGAMRADRQPYGACPIIPDESVNCCPTWNAVAITLMSQPDSPTVKPLTTTFAGAVPNERRRGRSAACGDSGFRGACHGDDSVALDKRGVIEDESHQDAGHAGRADFKRRRAKRTSRARRSRRPYELI